MKSRYLSRLLGFGSSLSSPDTFPATPPPHPDPIIVRYLVACCGGQEFQDGRRDLLLNPNLIVEVLSDSPEAYDRGDKFALYRGIPSLKDYLLVSQGRVRAELYTRGPDNRWTLAEFNALADTVPLASVGCTLDLAEVYDKVDLPAP